MKKIKDRIFLLLYLERKLLIFVKRNFSMTYGITADGLIVLLVKKCLEWKGHKQDFPLAFNMTSDLMLIPTDSLI
jgi:hypothetical protein